MKKLKMHTPNFTQENITRLWELFPGCVTESRDTSGNVKLVVDFDLLRQELSETIVEGPQERYHLNWPGKHEALLLANAPIAKTLRPCPKESVNFDTTKNLFIEGDNLEALKLLQEIYLGKVKMIYIDPPYNTGNDFIYKDDFAENVEEYLKKSNQRDENGNRMIAKSDSDGRFHSDWLSMMYSRLKLTRNLLRDDGVIFISIDDHQVHNLRKMCDEIFGSDNFIANFVWNTEGHTDNQYDVKVNHEYILLYAKSSKIVIGHVVDPCTREDSNLWKGFAENSITKNGSGNPPSEVLLPVGFPCLGEAIKLDINKPVKRYFDQIEKNGYITRQMTQEFDVSYPIRIDPVNVINYKLSKPCRVFSGWANVDKLRQFIKGGCKPIDEGNGNTLSFYLSERGVIYYRRDREKARNILSVLKNMGTTEQMRSELERMGIPFQYPKPKQLISYLLKIGADKDALVMDFFAGSGTTAQSIFELALDPEYSGIRFILCQFPEMLRENDSKQKTGYDFCVKEKLPKNISEICKERIRRTGKIVKEENKRIVTLNNLDIGFRVLKIDSSNMSDVYYTPDAVDQLDLNRVTNNIKSDRSSEDLLFQVLVDWSVDLSLPITKKTIQSKTVFFVDENALVACFDSGITEAFVKELTKFEPLRVVFRDNGFATDSVKINVEQIFEQLSPNTKIKSI